MGSSWSRLGSWLRRRHAEEDQAPAPGGRAGLLQMETPAAPPAGSEGLAIRLGLDFGTTTTLVAARIGDAPPRIIRLGEPDGWLPSYYWETPDGTPVYGSAAQGQPGSVHSLKLLLKTDAMVERYGVRASELAFRVVAEALRLTLRRLQTERVLPPTVARLEVATNVGCTPAFTLEQRALLRDICRKAGLQVRLVNLVVEPVAAAFELIRSGVLDGFDARRILVVDAGGGTLDIAVLTAVPGANAYTLYATSGHDDVGGDAFTRLIETRLRDELTVRMGAAAIAGVSSADDALLWQRSENAKLVLSTRPSVQVSLAGLAGLTEGTVELTRTWFETAYAPLLTRFLFHVTNTYRLARLVLDRGGPGDRKPGTALLECNPPLFAVRHVTDLDLDHDGREHLDVVFLVGGASQLPLVQRRFRELFGSKVLDLELLGLDPVIAVSLGLARHERIEALELRYPAWQVGLALDDGDGHWQEVELYEPYASTFSIGAGRVSWYTTVVPLPTDAGGLRASLTFRRVGSTSGTAWPPRPVPPGTSSLKFRLSLLGDIELSCPDGTQLYPEKPAAPWKPRGLPVSADWLPRQWNEREDIADMPWFDPVNDGPG
jgi:hypothetical protein